MIFYCQNCNPPQEVLRETKYCPVCGKELDWKEINNERLKNWGRNGTLTYPIYPISKFLKEM